MIVDKVKRTISAHNLICAGDKILIGLSGGADSVTLTHILSKLQDSLGFKIYASHVNHCIRGEEADRDEEFVHHFCEELGIECHILRVDIPKLAKKYGQSEETVGRRKRYEFFSEICNKKGIDKIATAHNRNDNAETILMNFMRGSGLNGLCGIPYNRDNIIRPLLDIQRDDIEKYCQENQLAYVTDSTNKELDYTRNKTRHLLLPLIEKEFNGNFINTVSNNACLFREDKSYIDKQAEKIFEKIYIGGRVKTDILQCLDSALKRRVIRLMIKAETNTLDNVSSKYIDFIIELIEKNSGASVNLTDGLVAKKEYGYLIISKPDFVTESFEYELPLGEKVFIKELSVYARAVIAERRNNDGALYLSYKINDHITIRNRRSGDTFSPYGMEGSKKVKEYFINSKIPRYKRNRIPIIVINGQIAAVGKRVDNSFAFKEKGVKIEFIDLEAKS